MDGFSWAPFFLTFKLALTTTLLLLLVGLPLAWWLARTRFPLRFVVDGLVSLPLVLPPTVLGFYFLVVFGKNTPIGTFLEQRLGIELVFSFSGLVLGSMIYSLPFMVRPLVSGFRGVPVRLQEAAQTLGAGPFRVFFKVILPNMLPALLSATVLTFAHTVGEFGVVMMIGGNLQGETRTASIAIFDEVLSRDYASAHIYSLILLALTFLVLLIVHFLNRKGEVGI